MTIPHCRYGDFSVPDRNDLIFNALREYGEWAQEELNVLGNFIRPGDTVIDAGAFIGTHARAFSQMAGAKGKIYAFEPNVVSYFELINNVKLASHSNIITYQMALGSEQKRAGFQLLEDSQENLGASILSVDARDSAALSVEVRRLDDFDFAEVNFIKADVEGMEYDLLAGGRKTILQHRPIVFLEANSLQNAGRIVDWARDMDYAIFGIISRAFNPENFNQSASNMFGEARECGLLLINRNMQGAWQDILSSLKLPVIETVDDLALLLLHKPQYFQEVLGRTAAADLLGIEFATPQIASLYQALTERDGQIASLYQALTERDGQIAQLLTSVSWRITKPLRFIGRLLRGDFESAFAPFRRRLGQAKSTRNDGV